MTLQTYWKIRGNKHDEPNDPLIVKWIEKLNLQSENIRIIHETKDGYARFTLHYDERIDSWVIGLPLSFDINHALHKLGYIWLWNNAGLLPEIKKNWLKKSNFYFIVESCILDNIVFYRFCNMDKDFKEFWTKFTIEQLEHFYNGGSWYKELPAMIYTYIVNYLNWNYILGPELQNKYSNYILYNQIKRSEEILEKAQLKGVYYSKRDFRKLHKLLREFEKIKGNIHYLTIQTYINQIFFYFPINTNFSPGKK